MNQYDANSIEQQGTMSIIVCQEKGRKYVLNNKSRKYIMKIRVDGYLIKHGTRCDYAIDVQDEGKLFLIELKGCDREHACEQLFTSLNYFIEKYGKNNYYCRAILSKNKFPNLLGKFEKLLLKAIREKKCIDYDTSCNIYDKDAL